MRYLFFLNTPAHVHLYRNALAELEERGHEVRALVRDYSCTVELADYYDLPYEVYGSCETRKGSLLLSLPGHYLGIARLVRGYDPDLIFGMGAYAAHTGLFTRSRTVLLLDSEPTRLDYSVSTPFAAAVLTPYTFRKDLGDDHYVFQGLKECAYLHPDVFDPDPGVREELGVDPDERLVILRLNAFGSHHDLKHSGIGPEDRERLLDRITDHATVLVSDEGGTLDASDLPEGARPFDVHPAHMHDALATADLLVADTQTMVTEAALMGTPAVRSNSFVGENDMGNFLELESAGLIRNCRSFEELEATTMELLTDDGVAERWAERREAYMADMVNLTDIIVDVAEARGDLSVVSAVQRRSSADLTRPAPEPVPGE
ncbi:hypothetical protein [Candidatus Halobonum tyrrellensis]|uniref:DUF354 domain-containing protein n=1 Tax=Candidatus Halobonum tyrrellensis G22 TaxID=1324957 RepID=V4HA42_9EURY|nr:hypothetical protein [Candidatus Halobonum tyrrellensis]ESP86918.1 hypothetical protein K933_16692 [Candidatus Halobonum tyrrellensis G22]